MITSAFADAMTTPDISPEAVEQAASILERLGEHWTASNVRALREALTAAEAQAQRAADDMWAAVVRADGLEEILARTDERATAAESALLVAAGLISTMDGHRDKHPVEVLEWIKHQAHGV